MKSWVLILGSEGTLGEALVHHYKKQGVYTFGIDLPEASKNCDRYLSFDFYNPHFKDLFLKMSEEKIKYQQILDASAVGYYGNFKDQSLDSILKIIEINFLWKAKALNDLFGYLEDQGRVIFIGSVASFMPTPDYSVYSASKAALHGLVRSLKQEFSGKYNIKIYHPGAIKSSFHKSVGFEPTDKQLSKFASPEDVAKDIFCFSRNKKWVRFFDLPSRILFFLSQRFPTLLNGVMKIRRSS